MEPNRFLRHWNYYISLEKMMINTEQYVAHEYENHKAYSIEFHKIINLSCGAVEGLMKLLATERGKKFDRPPLKKLAEFSIEEFKYIRYSQTSNSTTLVEPWGFLNPELEHANLEWWQAYNLLKHGIDENFNRATLWSAMNALGACQIMLRYILLTCMENDAMLYSHRFCAPSYFPFCNIPPEEPFESDEEKIKVLISFAAKQ